MDDGFWAMVGLASAIATALATGVATAAAFWWRWHDRTEADWLFFGGESRWEAPDLYGNGQEPSLSATLTNAGDGVAFRVEVTGHLCEAIIRRPFDPGSMTSSAVTGATIGRAPLPVVPIMRSGDTLDVYVSADPRRWENAYVEVAWTRSPTWKKRRSRKRHRVALTEIAPRPSYVGLELDELTARVERHDLPEP